MGKVKKNLGLGYLIIAAFFIFNTNIVIIDFLPDFIGYVFLILGLSQLADLNHHIEESVRLFKRLFIISLVQFLFIFFIFGFLPTREVASALMLACFTFGVLEIILTIPAYKALFEGFTYLGSRHDSVAVFKRKLLRRKTKRSDKEYFGSTATQKISILTYIFVISKPVLTFAPEILELFDSTVNPNLNVNYYKYANSFRFISLILILPIGIAWLIKFIKYIVSIINDAPFMTSLSQKYTEEVTPKTFLFIQRYIKLAFTVLSIALIFNIDFYIDYASVLPDFISPIILLIMFLIIKKFEEVPIKCYFFSVGYLVTSLTTYILNVKFYSNYTLSMTYIKPQAYNSFISLAIFKSIDSVFFVCMIISILPILSRIIMKNTGFIPVGTANNYNADEKIKYIHGMLNKKLTIITVLVVLAGISSLCYVIFLRSFIYIWIVEFIVYIVFVVYFIHTLNSICEEMEYKYMLY